MSQGGLLQWANSIRLNMATDSGRELFQQQVQIHGFLFLGDYLDNILSDAKQDPLIELVKTPGRRKAIARNLKLASKLGNPISFSLEERITDENTPVDSAEASTKKHENSLVVAPEKPLQKLTIFTNPESQHLANQRPVLNMIQPRGIQQGVNDVPLAPVCTSIRAPAAELPQPEPHLLMPIQSEQNELSVIAEDDEVSDQSRISLPLPPVTTVVAQHPDTATNQPPIEVYEPTPSPITEHRAQEIDMSSHSFHSIPLNSPSEYHSAHATPLSPDFPPSIIEGHSDAIGEQTEVDSDNIPTPATRRPPNNELTDIITVPFSTHGQAEITEMQVPLRDFDSSNQKPNALPIPSLPEPMPLRKSMRAPRDPSVGTVLLGAATPGTTVVGKRTSWLMKAREVKALDVTAKRLTSMTVAAVPLSSHPAIPSGSKRKSGDPDALHGLTGLEEEERKSKVPKTLEGESAPLKSQVSDTSFAKVALLAPSPAKSSVMHPIGSQTQPTTIPHEGVLDRLKKTVEGLGARVGKSMGKSLAGGSGLANGLAEARAAAEARVAERNHKEDEMTIAVAEENPVRATKDVNQSQKMQVDTIPKAEERRMSISDLFPYEGRVKEKHKPSEKVFQLSPPPSQKQTIGSNRDSTSTTPPNSPPAQQGSFTMPSGPVFNRPPPVFVPPMAPVHPTRPLPAPPIAKESAFQPPLGSAFSIPPSLGQALASSPSFSQPKPAVPLSAQSTVESVRSEPIFDDQDDVAAWMPSTQETDYTTTYGSQSQNDQQMNICDEDDSWPVDDKLAAGVQWTFGGAMSKEDSMTWSTLPSQSQGADTGPIEKERASPSCEMDGPHSSRNIPGAFDVDMEGHYPEDEPLQGDPELEDIVFAGSKITADADMKFRPQSQMSMASSASSQSQGSFLNQASKLISNALGTSKKKPEVKKVLQMAAVAAKKQQEEADKKATRLKEMESRRQLAIQRKTEEEKVKVQEEERKMKEEIERRKREREEFTDKRPLKIPANKKEEDPQKKKKIETEKKPELKKPSSTMQLNKSQVKPSLKQPSVINSSTSQNPFQSNTTLTVKLAESSKLPKPTAAPSLKGKTKVTATAMVEDELSQPSQIVQGQMAARAKAQIQAAKQTTEPPIPTENIELPDINSEYSDSEDEDRPRTFDPPNWAQSPELRQALQLQSTINPDDIFGAVRPLKMEEIFRTRTSRFRARTSSANWTGTDRLTLEEEREYARRMGFR